MATVFPNLLNMGPEIQIQNPASNRDFIVRSLLTNPQQPFNFTPVTGFPTRADRMAQVREQRMMEEAAQAAAAPQVVEPMQQESGGPDGLMSNDTFGALETDRFNSPAVVGNMLSLLGVPGAQQIGQSMGINRANERLDELVDPSISDAKVSRSLMDSLNPFGGFTGNIGDDFGEALDQRTAELDPLSTSRTLDAEFAAMVDAAYDRNKELAEYTDDFMQGAYGQQPSALQSFDELMATGGMSGYGQTFDSLPDIPDTARFDFSDLDEFGNPTVSYDSFGDFFDEVFGDDDTDTTNEEGPSNDFGDTDYDNEFGGEEEEF